MEADTLKLNDGIQMTYASFGDKTQVVSRQVGKKGILIAER